LRARIIELLGQPLYEIRRGSWRRISDLVRINVREQSSVISNRSIYPRMPVSTRFGGLERKFMETTLEGSPAVLAWCKLQRKHNLLIAYRDVSGLLRNYEVDFIVRTADRCYIIETKADRDLTHATVGIKAKAARGWCEQISGIEPPADLPQPSQWEYLLLSESGYAANQGIAFDALVGLMRQIRDRVIADQKGELFA
jgi:type III restriction enzyme